jgi:iron complex outermembrane recepter protein
LGRQFNERSEYDAHARFGADSFAPAMRLGITTHTGDLVFSDTLKNAVFLETGLSLTNQRNTRSGQFFIPNFKRQGAGGFLILGKKGRLWAWDASVRSDVFNQTAYFNTGGDIKAVPHDFFGTAGGLSIARTLGMRWLIRLQSSMGWRPPGINEQFANGVHHGAAAFERGNVNLQKERVLNNALSLSHKTGKTSVGAEFYANRFSGFIYLRPEPEPVLTIRGAFPAFAFDQADVLMTGADLWAEAKWGDRTEIRATASAVRARQTDTGEHLPWIPADLLTAELTRSFRDFGVIAKPRLSAGVRWQGKQWRPDPNKDFAPAPEGFALVNAGFAFSAGPADVRFGVTNLLNTRYRDYMNRFRYFLDEPGRNFTLRVDWPIRFKQYQTTF